MTKKKNLSTMEKFLQAKEGLEKNKYHSVEDAAEKVGISPATYYNYQNKTKSKTVQAATARTSASATSEDDYSPQEIEKILKEAQQYRTAYAKQNDVIESLQSQVNKLKDKVIDLLLSKA